MTKQETAEWLAEYVLHYKYCGECDVVVRPNIPNEPKEPLMLVDFIYSPEGLCAVIEQVRKLEPVPKVICLAWSAFLLYGDYEAFYNAVYEAMK